jgi:FkbM family methyltransferase
MAKIFIDGGGNWKKIVDRYLALADFDKVYVFEPNPLFYDSYKNSNYQLIKKAIWVENIKKNFYISKDENQVFSSLFENKLSKLKNELVDNYWSKTLEVDCIDFSQWVKDNFNEQDDITLKLDIEGAEFDVIEKMIEDKTIKMINKLFVEFHTDTCPEQKEKYFSIIKKLKNINIKLNNWD